MNLQVLEQRELHGKKITVYGSNENPLFLAKDVSEWIEHSNTSEMIKNVDEDEKLISTILSAGQKRDVLMLTENGLYEVLMQSRKPIAKEFKKAVKNILKQIRTQGGYIAAHENDTPDMIMARALQVAASTIENNKQKIKQLEIQSEIQSAEILKSKPLVDLANECYVSTTTMTASTMSARLGFKSANSFNKYLKDNSIQYKIKGDDCWKLTAKYSCNGYTKTITYAFTKRDGSIGTSNQMEWTESGFVFLREFINKKKSA